MGGHVGAIQILAAKTADGGAEAELELEDGAVGERFLAVLFCCVAGSNLYRNGRFIYQDRLGTSTHLKKHTVPSFYQDRLGTNIRKRLLFVHFLYIKIVYLLMQGRTPLAAAVEQGKGHAALLLQTLGTKNAFLYYTTTVVFTFKLIFKLIFHQLICFYIFRPTTLPRQARDKHIRSILGASVT
eukprot:COSAG06_NODE_16911_length_973_cov_6.672769_1_plen_184_part_00